MAYKGAGAPRNAAVKARNAARKEANLKRMADMLANRRSPQAQLKYLDRRFGVGQGAAKERAKIAAKLVEAAARA